ncbi:SsrA-binding protein SmpB [Luteithermobacter gelatinilyticus]|uniref:SsrA-binding protein SmpB n=1 Tax=Luteithermobacter gelatinilyticus TaxID=2582913 RepID=UPI001106623B|nr:SsrA-binding protein SmpB [Luteithermobacter gelatinilyticus]|tara:strand:- start:7685 stop:8158 length:474 start_codon:yes stop_codon:yes gene_type:complete
MAKNKNSGHKVVAENRKARFNFTIEEDFEAGIVLKGTEVKSLRQGEANISESYAEVKDGEVWLVNSYIKEYDMGNRFNHDARRPRKLLLHKREINRIFAAVQRKGMTLVPLSLYFNEHNKAKVKLALARGKKVHDKRATEKERDWNRQKSRLMKDLG